MRKGRSKIFLLLAAVTASHLHNADAHSVKAKVASHSMLQMEERVERDQPRNNFIQVKNESEQDFASARQEALEDLQAAFSMAPQEVTLNLGNSSKFSKAFKQYSETGVCNAWMDLKTGKITTDLNDNTLVQNLKDRIPTEGADIETLVKAIKSGDPSTIAQIIMKDLTRPLPLICITIGLFFFFLWLLFLVWQLCIGKCRKACFCIPSKPHNISFTTALIIAIIGGVLWAGAGFFITYGQTAMQSSVGAIGSSSCAALNLIHETEWGDENNNKQISEESQQYGKFADTIGSQNAKRATYAGIRKLLNTLNGVKGLCTEQSPSNILEILKAKLKKNSLSIPLDELRVADYAFRNNMEAVKEESYEVFAKSYMVEAVQNAGDNFYESFVDAVYKVRENVEKALSHVRLPALNFGTSEELRQLSSGLDKIEGLSADFAHDATPMAHLVPQLLWSEILFMLSGLLFAFVALVLFFLTKGKRGTCLTAVAWNWLLITVSLSLLTTAAVFWASSLGTPICDAGTKVLMPDSSNKKLSQEASLNEPEHIILKCIQEEDYNLFRASGISELVQQGMSELQKVKQTLLGRLPLGLDTDLMQKLEALQQAMFDYGRTMVYDLERLENNPNTRDLLYTFEEVLHSGIVPKTQTVKVPGKNDITVYGLEDVNRVIHPAVLKYTGYDSASLMVTATTPVKGEASFVKWLEDRKKEKEQELRSEGKTEEQAKEEAEDYIKKLENALLLLKYKIQLMENDTICYGSAGFGKPVRKEVCTGMQLFGRRQDLQDNLVEQSMTRLIIASRTAFELVDKQLESHRSYLEELFKLVKELVSSLEKSTSCSFVRKGMTEVAYLGCNLGIDYTWSSAYIRLLGQIFAILLALLLFVIWRMQKDNEYYEKKKEKDHKDGKDEKKKGKEGGDEHERDEHETDFTEGGRTKEMDADQKEQLISDSSMWA